MFDWDVAADRIFVSPEVEVQLGLRRGELEGPASGWLDLLHTLDRDRYRACLDTVLEQRCGRITEDFRLRAADGHYYAYSLKARPVVGAEGEVMRVVGTLSDVTDARTAEERLLHDAIHDNLTGLPNRELFFDRLDGVLAMCGAAEGPRPTVMTIDLDRFKQIGEQVGPSIGDSILLTVARRLGRLLRPLDTLARVGGDEFAMIIVSEQRLEETLTLADSARRALTTPVTFGEHEIALTASVGVAMYDPKLHAKRDDMLKDAEIAMAHAKRIGGNAIEVFRLAMRNQRNETLTLDLDLSRALERGEMRVVYQPIVRLEDRTIAGFEALLRWDHPRMGTLSPAVFIPVAEQNGTIVDLGLFVLDRAARELSAWQQALRCLAADLRQRQRLVAPVAAPRPARRRQDRAQSLRRDPRLAEARAHREPGDGKPGIRRADPAPHPGTRRWPVAGRFRHRLFVRSPTCSVSPSTRSRSTSPSCARTARVTDRSSCAPSSISLTTSAWRSWRKAPNPKATSSKLSQLGCEFAQGFAFGQPITAAEARKLVGATTEQAA